MDTIMNHIKSTHPYLVENEKEVNEGGLSGLVNYANKCSMIYLQTMQRYFQYSWEKKTHTSDHPDITLPRALYTSFLWELNAVDQDASIWDSSGPRLVDQWMDRLNDGCTPDMLLRELTVRRYIRSNTNDGHLLFDELLDTVDSCINYIQLGTRLVLRDIRNFITRRLAVFREFQELKIEKVHRIQRQFMDLVIPSSCLSNVTVTDELPSFRASTLIAQYERMNEMFSTYMRNGRLKSLQSLRALMERIFK
ncbi:uncharacterized protein LOC106155304 [Lingula anatina]|uniref:Uncharacterized protein LOC106155304 n=1 Tax=Lingula anatina TaxID=7574 RepID=A0A2R2MKV6_LINAN|nr:uncharacterized protein LOC106155304 [Lingula anatina]|eukprot:XP_023930697.1 uncharacterized protein LOC106155304 [Lingula anatina]